jgi:hypothetical protein
LVPALVEDLGVWLRRRNYKPAAQAAGLAEAHTFEEFDPADRVPAAEAIRRAREEVLGPNVRSLYARTSKAEVPEPGIGSITESRRPDSNRRHPLYERGALPTELRRRAHCP